MTAFVREIEKHFGFLRAAGYELRVNEAGSMSSGLAIFRSPRLSIQVIQDRSYWSFEAGPLGELRYGDHLLAEVLGLSAFQPRTDAERRDAAAVAEMLRRQLLAIEGAFAPERAAETLAACRLAGQDRAEELYGASGTGDPEQPG